MSMARYISYKTTTMETSVLDCSSHTQKNTNKKVWKSNNKAALIGVKSNKENKV